MLETKEVKEGDVVYLKNKTHEIIGVVTAYRPSEQIICLELPMERIFSGNPEMRLAPVKPEDIQILSSAEVLQKASNLFIQRLKIARNDALRAGTRLTDPLSH